jgi:LPS sulfotransferase NodH
VASSPIGFVLYGQSRSGSTLVAELARSHPEVRCDGELLTPEWGYVRNSAVRYVLIRYPFPYLEWRRRRAGGLAYGFKLMSYQLAMPKSALARLARDGWRFVHVRRRNRLQQSLSKLIAAKSGHWHRRGDEAAPSYRVRIESGELEQEIATREAWTRAEEDAIAGIDRLIVEYEDDLADSRRWQATMDLVFGHIGVAPAPVGTQLQRTDERGYGDVIENYADLVASLRKGAFAHYLDAS